MHVGGGDSPSVRGSPGRSLPIRGFSMSGFQFRWSCRAYHPKKNREFIGDWRGKVFKIGDSTTYTHTITYPARPVFAIPFAATPSPASTSVTISEYYFLPNGALGGGCMWLAIFNTDHFYKQLFESDLILTMYVIRSLLLLAGLCYAASEASWTLFIRRLLLKRNPAIYFRHILRLKPVNYFSRVILIYLVARFSSPLFACLPPEDCVYRYFQDTTDTQTLACPPLHTRVPSRSYFFFVSRSFFFLYEC